MLFASTLIKLHTEEQLGEEFIVVFNKLTLRLSVFSLSSSPWGYPGTARSDLIDGTPRVLCKSI